MRQCIIDNVLQTMYSRHAVHHYMCQSTRNAWSSLYVYMREKKNDTGRERERGKERESEREGRGKEREEGGGIKKRETYRSVCWSHG